MMKRFFVFFSLALLCGHASAEMRIWRDKAGKQVEGEFVRVYAGDVLLKGRNGENKFISIESLSENDAAYLKDHYIPELSIVVSKKQFGKPRSKNALADDKIAVVRVSVEFESKEEIENATLRAEVYLIGAEVATDDYRILSRESSLLSFTDENDYLFEFGLEAESRQYKEYNQQERGTLYCGYVVIVLDKTGEIVQHKSNLSWIGAAQLPMLRSMKSWYFFDDLCKRRPVPRPRFTENRTGIH